MTHPLPLFSIVIPTYARPERLANCLQSLTQLDYPDDRFEVIVVDDGSPTPMEPIAAPFREKLPLTLIRQVNAGPAKARNAGAEQAKGQFLAFTDDDCTPAPDWLKTLEARFTTVPGCIVGGRTLNALPNNLYSTASQVLIDYLYKYYTVEGDRSSFFASNNIALPAERFWALGGFDTSFPLAAGEDREFCDRWLYHGYPMLYAPEVQVYHAHSLTLPKFWRQHFNYGRGAFCFHQARARRNVEQIKVEPLSFYFKLLTYPLSQTPPVQGLLISVLFFLSQLANVTGFFWERSQSTKTRYSNI
ncbi:MAG: glycosyltransferase [Leptolyngbyaceae cyanobacterium SL_5_9]|nr:glycosyltransferase [Leptolyngbyaceae cyanobacterium SL_5_9]